MDRPGLRRALTALLVSSDEFDAFCLDNFPDVYRKFTGGMSRTQRENLLFDAIPTEDISDALYILQSKLPKGESSTRGRRNDRATIGIWLFGVMTLAVSAILMFMALRRDSDDYIGTIIDDASLAPISGCYITLEGTGCSTITATNGHFSLRDCHQKINITRPRIMVRLPDKFTWCTDIPLEPLPSATVIHISHNCAFRVEPASPGPSIPRQFDLGMKVDERDMSVGPVPDLGISKSKYHYAHRVTFERRCFSANHLQRCIRQNVGYVADRANAGYRVIFLDSRRIEIDLVIDEKIPANRLTRRLADAIFEFSTCGDGGFDVELIDRPGVESSEIMKSLQRD